jgi:glucose-6-phosphate isomerase
MFSGDKINETEGRAVLHTALRDFSIKKFWLTAEYQASIKKVLDHMKSFSESIISGVHKGLAEKKLQMW